LKFRSDTNFVLIDTYSTQNFYYAVIVAQLCVWLKIPYLPILHGGNLPKRLNSSKWLSQKLFKIAKTNVAPSHYLLEAFKKEGYKNIVFIPNTLQLEKYSFLARKNPLPKLLWVRSFSKIYNPEMALSILERLIHKGHKASLCMVGPEKDGSLAKCKQIAKERNLPVIFTGGLQKEEWISKSKEYDIFINTTHVDNTPVSVIEAMALGLPIVSTNVGGIPFLIENGSDGVLVPPNAPDLFADAISELLSNADITNRMALNARKKVESFDWEQVKHSWISLLND
jgi:glycosyltransferase involved in cell wall biosynthesis